MSWDMTIPLGISLIDRYHDGWSEAFIFYFANRRRGEKEVKAREGCVKGGEGEKGERDEGTGHWNCALVE